MKNILIINGNPRVLAEIKSELMEHFDVNIAATGAIALSVMETNKISVIIIYICNDREKAFFIFSEIFNLAKSKNIPVIFLSGNGCDEEEIAAFAAGAVDYSVRRKGTAKALADRINLRINAGELEKNFFTGGKTPLSGGSAFISVLKNKTILIAEDIEINRDIVAAMLSETEGLNLEFANDGKQAVDKFKKTPGLYSLILMDVQMPVMNGLDAARAIRHLNCENAREIPIIAATADVDEKEIKQCLDAGMDDYIEKPLTYEKILAAANKHCRESKTGNQL